MAFDRACSVLKKMQQASDPRWFAAASTGNIGAIYSMLNTHKRSRNELGETALMTAVRGNQPLVVQHLVLYEHSCINDEDFTALMIAVISNNHEAVEILYEYEHSVVTRMGQSALMLAIVVRNMHAVSCLAPYASGLRDNLGRTALMYAAFTGLVPAVQKLVTYEAGIKSQFGDTALSIAMEWGHDQVVNILQSYEGQCLPSTREGLLFTDIKFPSGNQISTPVSTSTPIHTPSFAESPSTGTRNSRSEHLQLSHSSGTDDDMSINQSVTSTLVTATSIRTTNVRSNTASNNFMTPTQDSPHNVSLSNILSLQGLDEEVLTNISCETVEIVETEELSLEDSITDVDTITLPQLSAPSEFADNVLLGVNALRQYSSASQNKSQLAYQMEVEEIEKVPEMPSAKIPHILMFPSKNSYTLLMRSVIVRNAEWFDALYPYESMIQDNDGRTALMHAACVNNVEAANVLLEFEAGMTDRRGQTTALMLAAQRGNVEIVKLLASAESQMYNKDEETALMMAARSGFIDIVSLLVEYEAGNQAKDGMTALMFAARNGHREVVRLMVALDVEVQLTNHNGYTALMIAAENNHRDIVSILAAAERGIMTPAHVTALMIAASLGHEKVVAALAFHEAGYTDADGCTALMRAAQCNHLSCTEILAQCGDELNRLTENRFNALHLAAKAGAYHTVVFLAQKEQFLTNSYGQTPLMSAAGNGHEDIVGFLIKYDMLAARDILGRTALMYASQHNHAPVIKRLLWHETGLQDKYGKTALMYAIESQSQHSIPLLLRESRICDSRGKTALEYAFAHDMDDAADSIRYYAVSPIRVLSAGAIYAIVRSLYAGLEAAARAFYAKLYNEHAHEGLLGQQPGGESNFVIPLPGPLKAVTRDEAQAALLVVDDLLDAMVDLLLGDVSSSATDSSNGSIESDQAQRIKLFISDYDEKLTDFITCGEGTCCVCLSQPSSFIGVPCGHMLMCRSCMLISAHICPFCKAHLDTVVMIDDPDLTLSSDESFSSEMPFNITEQDGELVFYSNDDFEYFLLDTQVFL